MAFERWQPRTEYTKQEQVLRRRLKRTGKLFGFLRDYRRELFDDEFQAELESIPRRPKEPPRRQAYCRGPEPRDGAPSARLWPSASKGSVMTTLSNRSVL